MLLRGFVLLILLVGALPHVLAETPLEITKTSKERLHIKEEVVTFYQALLKDNPQVMAANEKFIKAEEEPDNGRKPRASDELDPVLWEETFDLYTGNVEKPVEIMETYLIFQEIYQPAHHSTFTKRHIVARLEAVYSSIERDEPGDMRVLVSNTLTIKFKDFVDVTVKPVQKLSGLDP